jgi:hypothetical protein
MAIIMVNFEKRTEENGALLMEIGQFYGWQGVLKKEVKP